MSSCHCCSGNIETSQDMSSGLNLTVKHHFKSKGTPLCTRCITDYASEFIPIRTKARKNSTLKLHTVAVPTLNILFENYNREPEVYEEKIIGMDLYNYLIDNNYGVPPRDDDGELETYHDTKEYISRNGLIPYKDKLPYYDDISLSNIIYGHAEDYAIKVLEESLEKEDVFGIISLKSLKRRIRNAQRESIDLDSLKYKLQSRLIQIKTLGFECLVRDELTKLQKIISIIED